MTGFLARMHLRAGDAFLRHLDAQVAACHHDAVGHLEYLVDVVHALLVFYLGDDFNVAAVCVQYFLDVEHILLVAHKGVGNEVNVLLDAKKDVVAVFLGQRRQVDAHARHVDAFSAAQGGLVLHFAQQAVVRLLHHQHLEVAVVDKHAVTQIQVVHEVGIAHGDALARGFTAGVAHDLHTVTGLKRNRFCQGGSAHFGAFGVHEYADAVGHRTHVVYDFFLPVIIQVGGVHAHHVHSCVEQLFDEFHLATFVRDSGYNLCLFQ